MPVTITASVKCDRCDREQSFEVGSNASKQYIVSEANRQGCYGWTVLDNEGRNVVDDFHAGHVLCGKCAERFKEFVTEQKEREKEFFGK